MVLDSDALIKLEKAKVLKKLSKTYNCVIPKSVYRETVVNGKKQLYEDAFRIENIVDDLIEVLETEKNPKTQVKELTNKDINSLGKGETEALQLLINRDTKAIISDDKYFLKVIDNYNDNTDNGLSYLTIAQTIILLMKNEVTTEEEARNSLKKIKNVISDVDYKKALSKLGGEWMSTKPYPLRIPDELLDLAEAKSKDEHVDKSTALRELIYDGAKDYVLEIIQKGRITVSRGAEILDITPHEIIKLAEERNINIGATEKQVQKAEKTMEKIIKEKTNNKIEKKES